MTTNALRAFAQTLTIAAVACACARAQSPEAPLCVNSVCVGQALQDLPAEGFERALDVKVLRKTPPYSITHGQYLNEVERRPLLEQAYFLSALTQKFDGSLIRFIRSRADFMTKGICVGDSALTGTFRDAQGRLVEVIVSGGKPGAKVAGFYVTKIKKVFGRELDMKRFESEVRKTWPGAAVKEFNEEEANKLPVVIDTLLGHLVLQATPEEREAWSKASQSSEACESTRRSQGDRYQIN